MQLVRGRVVVQEAREPRGRAERSPGRDVLEALGLGVAGMQPLQVAPLKALRRRSLMPGTRQLKSAADISAAPARSDSGNAEPPASTSALLLKRYSASSPRSASERGVKVSGTWRSSSAPVLLDARLNSRICQGPMPSLSAASLVRTRARNGSASRVTSLVSASSA